jgi:hypothetical protein
MMKTIFGLCGCCCAAAGVLAGPDNDINIVAPSSEAQVPLCQPAVLRGAVGIATGWSFAMQSNMASLSLL